MVSELGNAQGSRDRRFPMRWLGRSLRVTSRVFRQPKFGRRRADDRPAGVEALAPSTADVSRQEETALQQVFDTIVTATAQLQRDLRTHPLVQTVADMLRLNASESEESFGVRNFPQRLAASQYTVPSTTGRSLLNTARTTHQDLTTTGSKTWGSWWDGRGLLRIKIYDFAIYVDAEMLQHAQLGNALRKVSRRKRAAPRVTPDLFQRVVSDHNVEMSLTVRPSRDLPLGVMAGEYKRILRRRMQSVGGNPDDEALQTLLQYFDEANLPPSATRRGCIKKDTVLNFCRSKSGTLTAVANGAHLTSVQSHKLCEAVFDLYLGDAPVSKRARTVAGQTMLEMMTQPATVRV